MMLHQLSDWLALGYKTAVTGTDAGVGGDLRNEGGNWPDQQWWWMPCCPKPPPGCCRKRLRQCSGGGHGQWPMWPCAQ